MSRMFAFLDWRGTFTPPRKKRDELKGKLTVVQSSRMDEDEVVKKARALANLWEKYRGFVDDGARIDSMSEEDIHRAVISKLAPSFDQEGKSPAELKGAAEMLQSLAAGQPSTRVDSQKDDLDGRKPPQAPVKKTGMGLGGINKFLSAPPSIYAVSTLVGITKNIPHWVNHYANDLPRKQREPRVAWTTLQHIARARDFEFDRGWSGLADFDRHD